MIKTRNFYNLQSKNMIKLAVINKTEYHKQMHMR